MELPDSHSGLGLPSGDASRYLREAGVLAQLSDLSDAQLGEVERFVASLRRKSRGKDAFADVSASASAGGRGGAADTSASASAGGRGGAADTSASASAGGRGGVGVDPSPKIAASSPPGSVVRHDLLCHLAEASFVKLAASAIEGVGVVATRDIPVDVDPFHIPNPHLRPAEECVSLSEHDLHLAGVPAPTLQLVRSFFAPLTEDDGHTVLRKRGSVLYGVNATGLNALDVSWYLNHSDDPNLRYLEAVEDGEFCSYRTNRVVLDGEELTIDYRDLGEAYFALVTETQSAGLVVEDSDESER